MKRCAALLLPLALLSASCTTPRGSGGAPAVVSSLPESPQPSAQAEPSAKSRIPPGQKFVRRDRADF